VYNAGMDAVINTKELLEWLGDDDAQAQLLCKEAPISESTLTQMKKGYQPHVRTAKAVLDVIRQYPPASNKHQAAG
jgi:hypothetical protein